MSKAAKSVMGFALYLFVLGPVLIIVPHVLLDPFGVSAGDVWVRVVGMLVIILGYYYTTAARNELRPFFKASVVGRASLLPFFIVFVLFKMAPWTFIILSLPDVIAAVWTAIALKSESRTQ